MREDNKIISLFIKPRENVHINGANAIINNIEYLIKKCLDNHREIVNRVKLNRV